MNRIGLIVSVSVLAGLGTPAVGQPTGMSVDGERIAARCLTARQAQRSMEDFSTAERRTIMTCIQRQAANQLNAQVPLQVDETTVLSAVTSEGPRLIYHSTITTDAEDMTRVQRAALARGARTYVCSSENMRRTLSYGGAYGYIWIDPTGVEITRTLVDRC